VKSRFTGSSNDPAPTPAPELVREVAGLLDRELTDQELIMVGAILKVIGAHFARVTPAQE